MLGGALEGLTCEGWPAEFAVGLEASRPPRGQLMTGGHEPGSLELPANAPAVCKRTHKSLGLEASQSD
jgi:hypothetical protein